MQATVVIVVNSWTPVSLRIILVIMHILL